MAQVALGWKPVPVPYFDFPDPQHKRVLYVREALAYFAGLALPLPCRPRSWAARKEALVLADMRRLVRSQPDCGLPPAPVSAAVGLSAATKGLDAEDSAAATASASEGTAALATPVSWEAGPSAAAATQGPAKAGSSATGAVPVAPEAGSSAAEVPGHGEAASCTAGAAAPAASQVRHVAAAGLQAAVQRVLPRLRKLPSKRASGQGGRFSLIAAAAVEAVRRRRRDKETASGEEGARALEALASGSAGGKGSGA